MREATSALSQISRAIAEQTDRPGSQAPSSSCPLGFHLRAAISKISKHVTEIAFMSGENALGFRPFIS
jgi:hypothetical protein